jgi:hypothetical protein
MKQEVARRMNTSASDELVSLSMDELRKADLLDASSAPVAPVTDLRRREMLRKVGLAGAAALLIPAITTLAATPAYALSPCIAETRTCARNSDCCSLCCDIAGGTNVCLPHLSC